MTEIEYRVADLINFSSNQKPIDFEQTFKGIISAKVSDAIEAKKMEISQTMFASNEQEEDEIEIEDLEDETEEEIDAEDA